MIFTEPRDTRLHTVGSHFFVVLTYVILLTSKSEEDSPYP